MVGDALEVDSKRTSYIEELKISAKRYRRLSEEERKPYLNKRFGIDSTNPTALYAYNRYPILFVDSDSDFFFGFSTDSDVLNDPVLTECIEKTGVSPLHLLIHALNNAAHKSHLLRSDLADFIAEKDQKIPGFPFEITKQLNFSASMMGGDRMGIGERFVHNLARALLNNNEQEIRAAILSIESQYFHEQIHNLNDESYLDNDTVEEMTQLGEFLYDPEFNIDRNAIFRRMNMLISHPELGLSNRYSEHTAAWKEVDLIILLHELVERGILQMPFPDDIEALANQLPELYARIPESERMNILKKWIVLKKTELHKRCEQLRVEMKMGFVAKRAVE